MVKHVLIIGMLIFTALISSNRVSQQKAVVTTNYISISAVEQVNIENLFNSIAFHTPSIAYSGEYFSHTPYINEEGKKEVFLGDMLGEGDILIDTVNNLNNNYLFNFEVAYNNTTKKVEVYNKMFEYGELSTREIYLQDGTQTNVFEVK